MSLTRALIVLVLLAPVPARALVKKVGADLAEGAMEKVQPVIAATLADVDRRLVTHEDRIGNIAGNLIDQAGVKVQATVTQVDHSLEARITQVQTAASAVTSEALDHVDQIARVRLVQVDEIASKTVREVNKDARALLDRTDEILRERSADLGRMVNDAVGRADQALAARIDQIDEVAGRRLGNVDVIASRQRIALERTIIQVAVLVGLVVFIIFVFKRLIAEHGRLMKTDDLRGLTGMRRTWALTRALSGSAVKQVVLAAVAVAVLMVLYHQLPLGAQHEQDELVAKHARALDSSLAQFDFTRARYHASQLELLLPDDEHHRALSAKAELLRDVFSRPTLWASDTGLAELQSKLAAVERLTRSRPDPDVLVVEAMLLWQSGQSRADEQRAASLCGRALRLRPGGFALGVLARAYIETYLQAPWQPGAGAERGETAHGPDELRDILTATPMEDRGSPLANPLALSRMMRALDQRASDGYVAMIQQQAKLADLLRRRAPAAQVKEARDRRNARAAEVVAAFEAFDRELMSLPGVKSLPDTLTVFRLDDVPYTRAAWYVRNPTADAPAPLLADLGGSNENLALRLQLAPPRVTWSRRFKTLIDGPARGVLEFQEAERFKLREQRARELEVGLSNGDRDSLARAALAAARLGLYYEPPGAPERTPLGRELAPEQAGVAESDLARALLDRGVRLL